MRFVPLFALALLTATPALAEPDSFVLGTGRDGPLSLTSGSEVINLYAPLAEAAPAGSTTLRLVRPGGYVNGQLVLVHQSSGLPANTPSGGTGGVNLGAVGRWELARVQAVGSEPPVLQLTAPLMNSYTVPGAQVVGVREYTSVTVSSGTSLLAPPWDGSSGGIVAFLATGTVTNNGRISADGAGFRGGVFASHEERNGCTGLDVPPEQGGAYKGEGVVVDRYGVAAGRGNLVNGGGGGNCHNSGGGGGGHVGTGGMGGRTSNRDNGREEGGLGGIAVRYSVYEQLVFGGGGGAGEGNNDVGSGGGMGGGVVFVRANAVTGAGVFSANGESVAPTLADDGAGGGGAGGAVMLRTVGALACASAQARGGNGGSVTDATFTLGPGGGGSGGVVLMQGTSTTCPANTVGGAPGTVVTADAGTYGAGPGGPGSSILIAGGFRTPEVPAISSPKSGEVGVTSRPRIAGVGERGVRIFLYVDGVELTQVSVGDDGQFLANYPGARESLAAGEHTLSAVAESLGAYSARSTEVVFNSAVSLEDGGVVVAPILVVPAEGEVVGSTPLFAGVAPNGVSVGVEVDNGPEVTIPVDASGRFRYQWPLDNPLPPGAHFVTLHAHNEAGETGPYSQQTRFETQVADAGTQDSGTPGPDAGSDDAGTQGTREVPVLVLPGEGEVVDPTPLFAGVAGPGASVAIEVDGAEVARVTADTTGAFRHVVTSEQALPMGAHSVTAHAVLSASAGPKSPATGFEVRGPAALDVGCGCGASPAGVVGAWALLAGLAAAGRRRRR
ncbi:adventurous gliding motility protein AgmC [Pyxidicoccus xibeiensis]|uniref:adventurous gliding motility protein AgmC n=1 Tax=Pyxidicoccus xibeiensis TaxID=2906759 RepID=UPI0020A7C5D9|nr:MYXO-CTERM sorting domain-containing protein [Pyxidicoccus xibeiensis]MCP3136485.1 MYXO-CTERM sorting domain-containing protein [Pyxidicoccus xibeiensis]